MSRRGNDAYSDSYDDTAGYSQSNDDYSNDYTNDYTNDDTYGQNTGYDDDYTDDTPGDSRGYSATTGSEADGVDERSQQEYRNSYQQDDNAYDDDDDPEGVDERSRQEYSNQYQQDDVDNGYEESTTPDSYRTGFGTNPSQKMPSNQDDYQDDYDSEEDEEFDDDYYGHQRGYADDGDGFDDEYNDYRTDEAEQERMIKKRDKRDERDSNLGKKIVAAVCCCCICLITILVLILLLLVFNEDDAASDGGSKTGENAPTTPKPTPRPTYPVPPALKPSNMGSPIFQPWIQITEPPTISAYPTNVASSNPTPAPTGLPTPRPTISPAPTKKIPPTITIDADQDTYIYVDGFYQYEAFGEENSFLVQNGLAEYYEFADALGLVAFDLTELPTANQVAGLPTTPQVILKLNHLPVAEQFAGRSPSELSVMKLISTPMRVETIHGGMLNKAPEGYIYGKNNFTVPIAGGPINVDISDLLYPEDFTEYDKNQLFIAIINNGEEQGDEKWTDLGFNDLAGDRFSSVESGDPPQLSITYL